MQNGSLIEIKRRSGQSVWEFRWRDRTSGNAVYRRIVIGTVEQFKTEADARELVGGIVLEINSDDPRMRTNVLTMSQLIEADPAGHSVGSDAKGVAESDALPF